MTQAEVVLSAAGDAGIKVGTDGEELLMVTLLRVPYAIRRSFEQAIFENKREIIDHILRENRR
jgi:hypothetical protein